MDIFSGTWDDRILKAVSGGDVDGLKRKLGPDPKNAKGGNVLGKVGEWWVKRYGFSNECVVAPFTGDNPSTIVTLSSPGDAILSLGTSTTLLVSIPPATQAASEAASGKPARSTSSHILAHPTTEGGFIYMLCYKVGVHDDSCVLSSLTNIFQLTERSPYTRRGPENPFVFFLADIRLSNRFHHAWLLARILLSPQGDHT